MSWSTPHAVYWISNTLSETLDQQADARYRAVSEPLRRQVSRNPEEGPPRLARGMYKRFVLAGVIITCLCAATIASAVLLEVKEGLDIFQRNTTPIDPGVKQLLADVAPGKPQTILVIGDDRRKAEALQKHPPPTRSDTMILVRLDPHQRATALMSLPRDLVVDIPGHGRQKLNAAFAYGEDRLTLRTVRNLLNIPIHHYVRVTFWGFRGAVDRLGCVYVDVDHQYFNDNSPPNGGGGPLCGDQRRRRLPAAVRRRTRSSYVRYRHLDNDLIRAARQQSFLGEAKNQIGVSSVFSDRKELLRIFGQSVRTDIDSQLGDPLAAASSWPSRRPSRSRRSSSPRRTPATARATSSSATRRCSSTVAELPGRARDEGAARRWRSRRRPSAASARASAGRSPWPG